MSFLYPQFLLFSLAVIVPIAVHLFNFHRFKRVMFSNVTMLRRIATANKKQNKLYERLLLFLRCLTIIFLSLLFANPYIKNNNSELKSENKNAVLVILDNSFSMQNISSKGSALENAKAKTEELLKEYSDNDVFCLLTMDLAGKNKHFVSKKTFMEFLKETEISAACPPYSQLLNTAHRLLNLRNEESKHVFFISDFQKSQTDFQNVKQYADIKDVFIPLETANINNVYIDSVSFDKNIYQEGQKVDLEVRVKNSSEENADNIPVKLYIDGVQQSMVNISLAKKSSQNVTMSFVIKKSGILNGRVQVLDSPVTYDDDFYFSINIRDKIHVLAINGEGTNKYLNRLFSQSDEVNLDNIDADEADPNSLPFYDAIILCSLQSISSGFFDEIKDYLSSRRTVVIIPPENFSEEGYGVLKNLNIPTYQSLQEKHLRVNSLDGKNPLYSGVFTSITENMPLPEVKKYYKIGHNAETSKQDIMTLPNGDAFLCESPSNLRGNIFMFACPLSENYSDFVNQSIFVPTLWNMVLYSRTLLKPFVFMNDNSFIDLSIFDQEAKHEYVSIENPKTKQSVIPQMSMKHWHWGFKLNSQIKQAGIYNIKDSDKVIGSLALNYPREESELSFLSSSELKKELKRHNLNNTDVFNERKLINTYFVQSNKKFDFSVLILIILLLCIGGEIFILRKLKQKNAIN
ncbi:MAG: BatA domain-containing protein [Bacteroidales bacterium]|nr:BatA domain-containing protein [Bacteroidales bacterium]